MKSYESQMTALIALLDQHYLPWLGQGLVILCIAAVCSYGIRRGMMRLLRTVDPLKKPYFSAMVQAARLPLSLSPWLLALGWLLNLTRVLIDLPLLQVMPHLQRVSIIVLLAWFLIAFVRKAYQHLQQQQFADSLLQAGTADLVYKLVLLLIIMSFGLMLLESIGISISGLLAFGGVGGLIVGLAAKDMLANIISGLILYFERPFHVGEKINVTNTPIQGWVKEIGWRQTHILSFERQSIYVPNALLGTSAVINLSRITHRRIQCLIGLRYQDLDRLPAITQAMTQYLRSNNALDQERPVEVQLVAYGASSLDVQIFCFCNCTDYQDFLHAREAILLKVANIVHEHGADFAFPTQTLDIPALTKQPHDEAIAVSGGSL